MVITSLASRPDVLRKAGFGVHVDAEKRSSRWSEASTDVPSCSTASSAGKRRTEPTLSAKTLSLRSRAAAFVPPPSEQQQSIRPGSVSSDPSPTAFGREAGSSRCTAADGASEPNSPLTPGSADEIKANVLADAEKNVSRTRCAPMVVGKQTVRFDSLDNADADLQREVAGNVAGRPQSHHRSTVIAECDEAEKETVVQFLETPAPSYIDLALGVCSATRSLFGRCAQTLNVFAYSDEPPDAETLEAMQVLLGNGAQRRVVLPPFVATQINQTSSQQPLAASSHGDVQASSAVEG